MTGLRRTFCILAALAALATAPSASTWFFSARADEVQDTFNQGVDLLQRGRRDESLAVFKKLLGMNPTQEQAYALWQGTSPEIWTDLLVEGGDFQLVAKRLMLLSLTQRNARKADKDAILELVKVATDDAADPLERNKAVRKLSSEHGEYSAQYLLGFLGTEGQGQRQILAMRTLIQLGHDVVVPLMAALHTPDAVQRRNITLVLGSIGDERTIAVLQFLAATDADETVKQAASESLGRMKKSGDAYASFLALGNDYFLGHDNVLSDDMRSDVIWGWSERNIAATPIPRELYSAEMSKLCYLHALHLNPSSTEALAGLARGWCDEQQKLERLEKAGKDVGAWKARSEQALAAIHAVGLEALDMALAWSVKTGDPTTGGALCRVLGPLAASPTPGLKAALASTDGALRSEAAVALGTIALHSGSAAGEDVTNVLAESVGRDIVRIALLIDADAERSAKIAAALGQTGVFVTTVSKGALGLLQARRAAGLDLVLLAESLPDITTAEVLDELKADERLANVPVVLLAAKVEDAAATYGDRIKGAIANADDMKPVQDALSASMTGDRALAEDLAGRAAQTLAQLCQAGRCTCSPAVLATVGNALTNRADSVSAPALGIYGACGGAEQVPAVLAILADEARSETVRSAAGMALSGILSRDSSAASPEALEKVGAVAVSASSAPVRAAASRAIALAKMDPETRAKLLRQLQLGAAH
jgi:CheY-like chemotaxis protein/tetratricopeptide (TPR) repeat protein